MPSSDSQAFLRELDKKLWTAADKLRSNLDTAVYKHAVVGRCLRSDLAANNSSLLPNSH